MRVAVPVWRGGVSPVFDVAEQILMVDVHDGGCLGRRVVHFHAASLPRRAEEVAELGVELLICGAVSTEMEKLLEARRVSVIPWVSGDPDEVLKAHCAGERLHIRFGMPGHTSAGGQADRRS